MSLNLFKYYHAQCFFFEFPLLLIINHVLRLRTGWLKIEDWKMDEDGSAVGRRWSCEERVLSCDEQSLWMLDLKMGVDECC